MKTPRDLNSQRNNQSRESKKRAFVHKLLIPIEVAHQNEMMPPTITE